MPETGKSNFWKILAIRSLGNFLLFGSTIAIVFTFWPLISAEVGYFFQQKRGDIFVAAGSQNAHFGDQTKSFGEILDKQKDSLKVLSPVDSNFGIIVEKIGANAPVVPNVNAADKHAYTAALQKGVAHAAGTVFPGMRGVSYLFSHSTDNFWNVQRYNAIFYLLRNVEPGDRIVTYFGNRRFDYIVFDKKILPASDVSYFTMKTDEPLLVLQTCDPPGTSINRLLVIARLEGAPVN